MSSFDELKAQVPEGISAALSGIPWYRLLQTEREREREREREKERAGRETERDRDRETERRRKKKSNLLND